MTDRLIAYLLDGLTYDERVEVEAHLLVDPAWQAELERLRECLADTGDPLRCKDAPCPNLLEKTCKLIEESGDGLKPVSIGSLGAVAMTPERVELAASSCRWSLRDVAVAAGILVALGSLFLPAIRESRDANRRMACASNLHWLGTQLFDYAERNDGRLPTIEPGQVAGMFTMELVRRGGASPAELRAHLVCPESELADLLDGKAVKLIIPDEATWDAATRAERQELARSMGGSYAYPLGYFDSRGEYHPVKFSGSSDALLLADAPRVTVGGVRIASHGGHGQFVLDQSLAVNFRTKCVILRGGDHIFLNDEGCHAAGKRPSDIVLSRSEFGPTGPIAPVDDQMPLD